MKATTCNTLEIGARMKAAREALGLGQAEFAIKNELVAVTYRRNENGQNEPGVCLINVFARAGINANWLLTGEGSMLLGDQAPPHAEAIVQSFNSYWGWLGAEQSRDKAMAGFVRDYNKGAFRRVDGVPALTLQQMVAAYDVAGREVPSTAAAEKVAPQPLNVGALKAILRAAIEMVQSGAITQERAADVAAKLYAAALETGEITPSGVGPGNKGEAA